MALGIGWICGKFLEGLPFRALGAAFTKYWFKNLCMGLAVGAVSLVVVIAAAMIFGGLRFHLNSDYGSSAILVTLGVSFAVFAVAAAFEEALFRGYILQTFSRAGLAWMAIIMTSLFFALAHLRNPGANWISSLNTAIAGVWFGVAYLKTRDLWLPFGMHFIWNWVQGSIFGIEVSGLKGYSPGDAAAGGRYRPGVADRRELRDRSKSHLHRSCLPYALSLSILPRF